MAADLADTTAAELINGYRAKHFTPLEALDALRPVDGGATAI